MKFRDYMKSVLNEDDAQGQKYYEIVFMQGDDAVEPLGILDSKGEEDALAYLKDWDYGKEMEHSPVEQPWSDEDDTYEEDDYIMSWNSRIGYIGLVRKAKSAIPTAETPPAPELPTPVIPPETGAPEEGGAGTTAV